MPLTYENVKEQTSAFQCLKNLGTDDDKHDDAAADDDEGTETFACTLLSSSRNHIATTYKT